MRQHASIESPSTMSGLDQAWCNGNKGPRAGGLPDGDGRPAAADARASACPPKYRVLCDKGSPSRVTAKTQEPQVPTNRGGSGAASAQPHATRYTAMPALIVDTTLRPAPLTDSDSKTDRPASPDRPPVSPITPTSSVVQLVPDDKASIPPRPAPPPASVFRPQPASVAISESENPDAIALRSAISLLQLQREKSKRDLKALQELKAVAISDPQAFARSLQEQKTLASQSYQDILTPTLSGLGDAPGSNDPSLSEEQSSAGHESKDLTDIEAESRPSKMPSIPQPQNIVRCPPVNWAKYHVVGEPLNKMHEEQKKWPGAAEPPLARSGTRAPPHAVTAPYSPFTDGLSQSQTASHPSKASKKPPY